MLAAMKAVRIPTTGSVDVIDLIAPVDGDATAFLASLYAAIGCQSGVPGTRHDLGPLARRDWHGRGTRSYAHAPSAGWHEIRRLTRTCTAPAKISGVCYVPWPLNGG